MALTDFCRTPVVSVLSNVSVVEAAKMMADKNIGSVVVVEENKPIGLLQRVWISMLVILTLLGITSSAIAQTSRWHNITGAICYIHIEWPNGEVTDFALQPHETQELPIQSDPPPKYCWSHRGPITDCHQACRRGDAKGTWSVSTTAMNGCEPGVISTC